MNRFTNEPLNVGSTDGFGGGFGGGGLLMGLLFGSILNRNGGLFGGNNGGSPDLDASGIAAKVVELQNSANVLKEVAGVNTTVEALGNEMQNAFAIQNLGIQSQFNQVDSAIAQLDKNSTIAALESKLAAVQSQAAIQGSIEALSTKTDAQYAATLTAIATDGSVTRALINANEMQNLRDELMSERRRSDAREVEINITNSNAQSQNQLQAQLQSQNTVFASLLNPIVEQLNRQTQGIVNLGTMTGNLQTATAANTRVN